MESANGNAGDKDGSINSGSSNGVDVMKVAIQARKASFVMSSASTEVKDSCLSLALRLLRESREEIVNENRGDMERQDVEAGLKASIMKGLDDLATKMKDPVGKVLLATKLDDGLDLYRVSCPIGVICVIFESRPEAVVQIASLAIKSGNALILKGGKEAARSNQVLAEVCFKFFFFRIKK
jgi:glutamate-5-semialdehyde dehydrogenase